MHMNFMTIWIWIKQILHTKWAFSRYEKCEARLNMSGNEIKSLLLFFVLILLFHCFIHFYQLLFFYFFFSHALCYKWSGFVKRKYFCVFIIYVSYLFSIFCRNEIKKDFFVKLTRVFKFLLKENFFNRYYL